MMKKIISIIASIITLFGALALLITARSEVGSNPFLSLLIIAVGLIIQILSSYGKDDKIAAMKDLSVAEIFSTYVFLGLFIVGGVVVMFTLKLSGMTIVLNSYAKIGIVMFAIGLTGMLTFPLWKRFLPPDN